MSLRFLSARTFTFVVAGRAAMSISSPGLNGLGTPLLALRAGTFFFSILTRPGSVKAPAPRRPPDGDGGGEAARPPDLP